MATGWKVYCDNRLEYLVSLHVAAISAAAPDSSAVWVASRANDSQIPNYHPIIIIIIIIITTEHLYSAEL